MLVSAHGTLGFPLLALAAGQCPGLLGLAPAFGQGRLADERGRPRALARNIPPIPLDLFPASVTGDSTLGGKPPVSESWGQPQQSKDRAFGPVTLVS